MFAFTDLLTDGRTPPNSLSFKDNENSSSSDYESICSLGGTSKFKGKGLFSRDDSTISSSSPDYESIKILSSVNEGDIDDRLCDDAKQENVGVNDPKPSYTCIPITEKTDEIDTNTQPTNSFSSQQARAERIKLFNIDDHGYATVLPPAQANGSCEPDYSDEDDCLAPSPKSRPTSRPTSSSPSREHTVSNVEEAWRHQLERGYAPLTLKSRPPCPLPSRDRASSDKFLSKSFPVPNRRSSPQDYEIPVPCNPPLPPPIVTNRKNSNPLAKLKEVFQPSTEQENKGKGVDLTKHIDRPRRYHSATDETELTMHIKQLPHIS